MLPEQKHCDVVTVDVITEMAPKWLMDREREDPGQRDDPCPGLDSMGQHGVAQDFIRLLRTACNSKLVNRFFLEVSIQYYQASVDCG